jgi:mRNA interferase RelE/StbE
VSHRRWSLAIAAPARRAVDRLPAKVAAAILDFIVGPLLDSPRRVGKELRGELRGLWSARVGAYRVLYEIEENKRTVNVIHIDHRADVYRPR